jgi:hypothetical protein
MTSKSGFTQHSPTVTLTVQIVCIPGQRSCDAGVTQNLPTLPKLTSLTLQRD